MEIGLSIGLAEWWRSSTEEACRGQGIPPAGVLLFR